MSDSALLRERLPAFPDVPDAQRGRGDVYVRYEDVTQDGRLAARAASHAIGAAVWRDVLERHPLTPVLVGQGILPILARLVVVVGGGPIGVRARLRAEGGFEIVEAVDEAGKSRFRADMWAELRAPRGRTFGSVPGEGEEIAIGAVWGEHVMTRPFAPPSERTVDRVPEGFGTPRRVAYVAPPRTVELPEGARWLEDAWVEDATPIVFGLGHTDSNQHVNSLVYPQELEAAALRRLVARGLPCDRFATRFEMAYRKPSFAGDRLVLSMRLYERTLSPARVVHGVAGVFATTEEHARGLERARVFGTLELEP
jgi:hypothetical protein